MKQRRGGEEWEGEMNTESIEELQECLQHLGVGQSNYHLLPQQSPSEIAAG